MPSAVPESEPTPSQEIGFPTSHPLIKRAILDKAADLPIFDRYGAQHPFKSLYWASEGQRRRVMIIFIRHFFCGNCQEFTRALNAQIPPESLPEDLSIVLIGCGAPSLLPSYIEDTPCLYPLYADPSKKLYTLLGMQSTLSLGWKDPEYIQHTLVAGAFKSFVQGVRRIPAGDALAAGDIRLNGGEFLFEVEGTSSGTAIAHDVKENAGLAKLEVTWCHRMTNTRDHAEISEIRKVLGSLDNQAVPRRRNDKRWPSGALRRSFSSRRQSWLDRSGGKNGDDRSPNRKRSPDRLLSLCAKN